MPSVAPSTARGLPTPQATGAIAKAPTPAPGPTQTPPQAQQQGGSPTPARALPQPGGAKRPLPSPGAAKNAAGSPKQSAPSNVASTPVPIAAAAPVQARQIYDPSQDYAYDHYPPSQQQQQQQQVAVAPVSAVQNIKLTSSGGRRPRSAVIAAGSPGSSGSPGGSTSPLDSSSSPDSHSNPYVQQQQSQEHYQHAANYGGYDTTPATTGASDPNAYWEQQQQYQHQQPQQPQQQQYDAYGYPIQPQPGSAVAGWEAQTAAGFYYEDTYAQPPEEVDLASTSDAPNAASFAAPAMIELDFSVAVPGSKEEMNRRARASTLIRNIDTDVFALEAFSDMEQYGKMHSFGTSRLPLTVPVLSIGFLPICRVECNCTLIYLRLAMT